MRCLVPSRLFPRLSPGFGRDDKEGPASEERPHLLLQRRHELRLHEGVVVGDVEADDAGALQLGPEAALEFGAVGALHDEDDVGPCHQFGGARLLRIRR